MQNFISYFTTLPDLHNIFYICACLSRALYHATFIQFYGRQECLTIITLLRYTICHSPNLARGPLFFISTILLAFRSIKRMPRFQMKIKWGFGMAKLHKYGVKCSSCAPKLFPRDAEIFYWSYL